VEILLLEDQDMALRNEDRVWIAQEIRTSMQEHLHPHGWRRAREWIPLGGIITIMVGMLALAGAGWNYGLSRMRDQATFEAKTTDRLDIIERTLRGIRASQDLREISRLDQSNFDKSLPVLQKVLDQSSPGVQASQEALREVADRLRKTNPESADYWPTVLKFLTVASAGLAPPDVPSPGEPTIQIAHNRGISVGGVSRQVVLLDGGELVNSTFENSRIIFTKDPVTFHNVIFVNCVFQLPVTNSPNDYLKKASQILLASNLTSASFISPLLK
jgi:hypothetical protein